MYIPQTKHKAIEHLTVIEGRPLTAKEKGYLLRRLQGWYVAKQKGANT